MRNVTVNGRSLPVDTRGETILVYMDEFGRDILQDAMLFMTCTSASRPNLSITSKLMYAYIKTANEDMFKNYRVFMRSFKNVTAFLDKDNVNALVDETMDLLGVEREESKDKDGEKPQKKRTARAKKTD